MKYRIDEAKNRIYFTMEGIDIKDEEKKSLTAEIEGVINSLPEGFTVLTDIRNYKLRPDDDLEELAKIQKLINEKAGKIVRVVGKKTIAQLQMNRASNSAGYSADYFSSIEEAEKALDEFISN